MFRFFNHVFRSRSPLLDKILSQYSEKSTNWTIQSSIREKGKRIFSSSERPDWLWGSPDPVHMGTGAFFRPAWCCRGVRLTAHLHIVCLRMSGIIISSPCVVSWFAQGKQHRNLYVLMLSCHLFCFVILCKDHFSRYFACNIRYDFCTRKDHVAHPNTTRTTGDMTAFYSCY